MTIRTPSGVFDKISALCVQLLPNFIHYLENSVDPDQLASDEASWLASTLFFFHTINTVLQMKLRQLLWTSHI